MTTFTFLCVRPDGGVPSMELSDWPDVMAARTRAAQLLSEHSSCAVVEVWDDAELRLSLPRDSDRAVSAGGELTVPSPPVLPHLRAGR